MTGVVQQAADRLKAAAERNGEKSVMTHTPEGDTVILIGADEPEPEKMMLHMLVLMLQRRESQPS